MARNHTVRLEDDLSESLSLLALAEGKTLSDEFREAIQLLLDTRLSDEASVDKISSSIDQRFDQMHQQMDERRASLEALLKTRKHRVASDSAS